MHELSGSRIERHIQLLLLLAITSSSADRESDELGSTHQAHLRTIMLDDWFSSLMVLVSEKDVLECITIDRIIDRFATLSTPLQKLLT